MFEWNFSTLLNILDPSRWENSTLCVFSIWIIPFITLTLKFTKLYDIWALEDIWNRTLVFSKSFQWIQLGTRQIFINISSLEHIVSVFEELHQGLNAGCNSTQVCQLQWKVEGHVNQLGPIAWHGWHQKGRI